MRTLTTIAELATVTKGEVFLFGNLERIAYADAEAWNNRFTGEPQVRIDAGERSPGSRAAYALSTIFENAGTITRLAQ